MGHTDHCGRNRPERGGHLAGWFVPEEGAGRWNNGGMVGPESRPTRAVVHGDAVVLCSESVRLDERDGGCWAPNRCSG